MAGRGCKLRENKQHQLAFNIYRDLGHKRSYMETAKRIGVSPNTIANWSRRFGWETRLSEHRADLMEREAKGAFLELQDPILNKIKDLIEEVEALIDSVFEPDISGRKVSKIEIKHPDDLIKLVGEYRRILESYYSFVSGGEAGKKKKETRVDKLTVFMGDMTQEERIKVMQGSADGNVPRGDKQPDRRPQDADYTDVSG
uniref:Uncharacterized protein n=1 Tax=viral metagenome TaxID=1070528 RepID=A0A6M3KZD0_9ZZZZ